MVDRLPLGYDLDMIPVQKPDNSTWLERLGAFLKSGGPWGTAQPGQRGTFVPSRINEQGRPELAFPGLVAQPAESLQSLMTAPLSDIVRSGDRDAIRAASEASFDVASMLPAAGVAAGRMKARGDVATEQIGPLYRGTSEPGGGAGKYTGAYWATPDREMASQYALGSPAKPNFTPAVTESFARFKNPLIKDAGGKTYYDIDTDGVVKQAARDGHDGVIFNNVIDPPTIADMSPDQIAKLPPSTSVAAIKRGTMFDRWGNQVFSNPDDLNTSAILAAMSGLDQPGRMTGEDVIKATTKRPANVNEPEILSQLQPGPRDTASFRGYQQGEVQPLVEPKNWDYASRDGRQGQPAIDTAEQMFPRLAAKAKDHWDVIDAAKPILSSLRDKYGANIIQGSRLETPQDTARMIQVVNEGVKAAGEKQNVMQNYAVQLVPDAERAAWIADGSRATLYVGTKATSSDVASAIRSRIAKDGRWKPFDGVYSNPDDITTAAILALLTAQQQGGQPQQ